MAASGCTSKGQKLAFWGCPRGKELKAKKDGWSGDLLVCFAFACYECSISNTLAGFNHLLYHALVHIQEAVSKPKLLELWEVRSSRVKHLFNDEKYHSEEQGWVIREFGSCCLHVKSIKRVCCICMRISGAIWGMEGLGWGGAHREGSSGGEIPRRHNGPGGTPEQHMGREGGIPELEGSCGLIQ
eukprot:1140012-Pelagomonas_calceolata.AAC.8